jgi:ABC-2 type transport system permease protein
MIAPRALRVLAALLRVGLLEAVAYRGEMLVWVLSSTMPLIMFALFDALVQDAPIGRYGESELAAYFLATFIVRQLTSSWISWQINMDVRDGTLGTRLLRPVHPLVGYTADSIAVMPLRLVVSLPVAIVLLVLVGTRQLPRDPAMWLLWAISIAGGWLISLFVSFAIGALALFIESSTKVMDAWLALYFVFSGYLVPIAFFPARVRALLDFFPFRYQIGLSVELMTGAHARAEALALVGRQWAFVAILAAIALVTWRRGLERFTAYGG